MENCSGTFPYPNRFGMFALKPIACWNRFSGTTDVFANFTNQEKSEIEIDLDKVNGQKKVPVEK